MDTILDGLQEQGRLNVMDELRRFIEVDTGEAAEIGDVEKKFGGDQSGQAHLRQKFSQTRQSGKRTFRRGEEGMQEKGLASMTSSLIWVFDSRKARRKV